MMTEDLKGKSDRPKKRSPYVPSQAALAAISTVTTALEGLSAQDRGHVVARVLALYGKKAKPSSSPTAKQSKKKPQRSAWKAEWMASSEYQKWDAAKGGSLPQKEYSILQADAFRVRSDIRAKTAAASSKKSATQSEAEDEQTSQGQGQSPRIPTGPSAAPADSQAVSSSSSSLPRSSKRSKKGKRGQRV